MVSDNPWWILREEESDGVVNEGAGSRTEGHTISGFKVLNEYSVRYLFAQELIMRFA